MPTSRPRLTVTLTPEIDRALSDLCRLTSESKSGFIVQLLAEAVPQMQKIALVMQQATKLKGEARASAKERLTSRADALIGEHAALLKSTDLFFSDIVTATAPDGGKRAAASAPTGGVGDGAAADRPPLPNRGGRNSDRGGKVVSLRGKNRAS